MEKLIKTIATVFGIGYIPYAQGTIASIAGVALYLLIHRENAIYLSITILLIIIGFGVSGSAERIFGRKDSEKIVIDELCGILTVFLLIPFRIPYLIIGFICYRLMDILKIYPLNRIEKLPSGWGIMLDDIAAGIYTNILLQIIHRFYLC